MKYSEGCEWSIEADIFSFDKKHYLCIVDYHSKFLVMKQMERISRANLIKQIRLFFSECGLSIKTVSEPGTNLISEKFENFCKQLSVQHIVSSSYNHCCNGQEEACTRFCQKKNEKNVMRPILTYICLCYKINTSQP